MKIKAYFFKPQRLFLQDQSPISAFIGGVGSGKTLTGARWLLASALKKNNRNFYACANTYPQLKDVLFPKFFGTLKEWGLREKAHWYFNKSTKDLTFFNGSLIMFRSLANYNMLRGAEVSAALIDEARDVSEEAVKVVMGRLRQAKNAQLKLTTTPNGYNWLYDWIQEGRLTWYKMTTYDNTQLPESYVKMLEEQYTGDFYRQEIMAEFVNFGGRLVYGLFDRRKHVIDAFQPAPTETIHIGLDFNVDPFCAIACAERQGKIYAFQEIILHGLDINAMVAEIKKLFPNRNIFIYPDSSGKNRHVAKTETLIGTLKRGFGLENVKYFSKNPRIVDRIQTVNNWLAAGKVTITKQCEWLIRDLERVKFVKSGAFELDKTEKDLTHISDGLGYMIYYMQKAKSNEWRNE